jgi:hypothetical protein
LILVALIFSAAYLEDKAVAFELVASVSITVSMINDLVKESEVQDVGKISCASRDLGVLVLESLRVIRR